MVDAFRPVNLEQALRIRAAERALVLAGGTDFMLKRGHIPREDRPVLYIGQLKELRRIVLNEDGLRIGAACTLSELLESPLLPGFLKLPLAQMASPAIRNVATIGGNLCNASPAGDALPMLYALDAVLYLRTEKSEQRIAIEDFILEPGRTRLGEDQLLAGIQIPLRENWRCAYQKVGVRRANSLSKISFYAVADRAAGRLRDVRVAFGAVAPTVIRCRTAEEKILSGAPISQITELYDALLHPIDDVRSSREYRRTVSLRLLHQYLTEEMRI